MQRSDGGFGGGAWGDEAAGVDDNEAMSWSPISSSSSMDGESPLFFEPLKVQGAGSIRQFAVMGERNKKFDGYKFKHHCRVSARSLVIDGCLMLDLEGKWWTIEFGDDVASDRVEFV